MPEQQDKDQIQKISPASGSKRNRNIRAFISSTFQDMHAERDHLVRFVFPELKEKCRKRRVNLIDVDLRWGVTEADAQDGKALDICLDEIDSCRPYFLGLIGHRYGWTPPGQEHSITAQEIYHGVLHNDIPRQVVNLRRIIEGKLEGKSLSTEQINCLVRCYQWDAEKGKHLLSDNVSEDDFKVIGSVFKNYSAYQRHRSFFFFRSEALTRKIARHNIEDFFESEEMDKEKLADLKQDIIDYGLPCFEYDNIEAFGNQVRDFLWKRIEAELGETVEIEKDWLEEEAEFHELFVIDRTRRFVGRRNLLDSMRAFCENDGESSVMVITGESGCGKSALMGRFTEEILQNHPDWLIIPHFVGASPTSTNLRQTLRRFCTYLNRIVGSTEEVPEDIKELFKIFPDMLAKAAENRRILLILDAANQLENTDNAHDMRWLPQELPENVRFVVSTLAGETHEALLSRRIKSLVEEVAGLDDVEIKELVNDYLKEIRHEFPNKEVEKTFYEKVKAGNPLYIQVALEELRVFGKFEELADRINNLPENVSKLFNQVIERIESDFNKPLVCDCMSLIACGKHGMTAEELQTLLREYAPRIDSKTEPGKLPDMLWARLYRAFSSYLFERSGVIDFFHGQLKEAAGERYLQKVDTRISTHKRIADYFENRWKEPYHRALDEHPHQLTKAMDWDGVERILTDLRFIEAKCADRMTYDLVADYKAALDSLPEAQEEKRKEKEHKEQIRKYTEDLIAYARGEIPSLDIIPSIEPWSGEKIKEDTQRIIINSSRLDRIRAFSQFMESDVHALATYGSHSGFCIQQAYNSAKSGPVASTAETIVNHEVNDIYLLQLSTQRPKYNPHPAFLTVLGGHTGRITSVSVTPDCRRAVSGSWDNTVRVWDLDTSTCLYTLTEHTGMVESVSITPDGHYAASGSVDNTVRVWDLTTGVCLHIFDEHTDSVTAVAINPDGRFAISGSDDRTIKVWDLKKRVCVNTLKSYSIKKKTFQDTCSEMLLEAMKPETRSTILAEAKMFRNPTHDVKSLDITLHGGLAVSGSGYGRIRFWDLRKGKCINTFEIDGYDICTVVIASDGRRVVTVGFMEQREKDEGLLRIWEVVTGECVGTIEYDRHLPETGSLAITPDCSRALTGSGDGAIHLWDLGSGVRLRALRGHTANVTSVAITPDARYALSGSEDKTIRIWDLESGESTDSLEGHQCITITPNGKLAITGNRNGTVYVWDISTGQCIKSLRGHTDGVISVTCTMDGRYVLSGSDDGTVRMWNMETSIGETTLDGGEKILRSIFSVYVTADACRAVTASHASIRVWDLKTAQCIQELTGHTSIVNMLVLTPDNRYAITGSGGHDNTLRVWDLSTGRCLNVLQIHTLEANCVVILPDGKRCAVSGWNLSGPNDFEDEIRIWDIQSGIQLGTLKAGVSSVTCMSISHDGKYILSGRRDGVIQIWDIETRTSIKTLEGHDAWITALCTTEDDSLVVSASRDGTIRVWRLDSGALVAIHRTSGGSVKFLDTKFSCIVAGTENGSLDFVELLNVSVPDKAPLTTAKRVWQFGDKRKHQGYDNELTAICPWCGSHFSIQSKKREGPFKILIKILSRTDVRYLPSVKVELGSELACPVPSCGKVIKLNEL